MPLIGAQFSARRLLVAILIVALSGGCTSFSESLRRGESTAPASNQGPDSAQVQALLDQVHNQLLANDLAVAEENLQRAAQLEPRNPWVALNLGVVYQRTGRTEQARSEYRKVLAADGPLPRVALASDRAWQKNNPADMARHNLNLLKQEDRQNPATPILNSSLSQNAALPPVSGVSAFHEVFVPAEEALLATLEAWRAAWAARDINAYLAHYAEGFRPATGNRATWAAERRRNIAAAGNLDIQVESPHLRIASDNQATIVFRQYYRAAHLSDVGTKKLTLTRNGQRWLIQQESFTAEAR